MWVLFLIYMFILYSWINNKKVLVQMRRCRNHVVQGSELQETENVENAEAQTQDSNTAEFLKSGGTCKPHSSCPCPSVKYEIWWGFYTDNGPFQPVLTFPKNMRYGGFISKAVVRPQFMARIFPSCWCHVLFQLLPLFKRGNVQVSHRLENVGLSKQSKALEK